jgi:hypothetical protein
MIVSPHIFNYRLIISSLLVVLAVLGVFSFTNYKTVQSHEEFLKQEKVLIENELSEILLSYDERSEAYSLIDSQLQDAKIETKNALDSLRLLKSDLSIITKFKGHLTHLKSKSKILRITIDSLNSANLELEKEKRHALSTIKKKTNTINVLEETNVALNKTINNAAVLKASNVTAKAYKLRLGKKRFTDRAKRANTIDVCINLNENPLTKSGRKDVYIQILNPKGNVVADKGEVVFGDSSLIYSKKEIINYTNENLKICTAIVAEVEDQPFLKGYYFINVFHENVKLGSARIKLK